jgi:predicted nucleotidyltransferase
MLNVKPESPVEPVVLEVLEYLNAVAAGLGIPYLMIGARALDIQLHNVYGLPTFNPTNDTDFAVAVESWKHFDALKDELIKTGRFTSDSRKAQRIYYDRISAVDLVPFGGLEKPQGSIAWPPEFDQVMKVQGFAEINSAAEEISIPGRSVILRAASLPGLLLLKLFAWDDRRETKDAWNISSLLQYYNFIIDDARIFSDEALYKFFGYDAVKAGAALLGKDAAIIATPANLHLAQKIVLNGMKKGNLTSQVGSGLKSVDSDNQISAAEELLQAFLAGFQPRPL